MGGPLNRGHPTVPMMLALKIIFVSGKNINNSIAMNTNWKSWKRGGKHKQFKKLDKYFNSYEHKHFKQSL